MAGKLSYIGAANALDGTLGRATQTARGMYLALLTTAPTAASTMVTMTEYSAAGYARQAVTLSVPSGTPRLASNSAVLNFPAFTGANGSTAITYWALVSAVSGTAGDLVAWGDFTTSRTPAANDSVSVAIGAITVTID
jgi:hypothetical protein